MSCVTKLKQDPHYAHHLLCPRSRALRNTCIDPINMSPPLCGLARGLRSIPVSLRVWIGRDRYNPFGSGLDNINLALKKLEKYPNKYKKIANFIGFKIAVIIFFSSARKFSKFLVSTRIFFLIWFRLDSARIFFFVEMKMKDLHVIVILHNH
jgi:hypothetical protein